MKTRNQFILFILSSIVFGVLGVGLVVHALAQEFFGYTEISCDVFTEFIVSIAILFSSKVFWELSKEAKEGKDYDEECQ